MPRAAYFRRQADICLRLSLIASDDMVSKRLVAMARDYMATSQALEPAAAVPAPILADRFVAAGTGGGQAAVGLTPGRLRPGIDP
jgi:hypothetical protein